MFLDNIFRYIPRLAGYPFRTLATGFRKICGNSMALLVAPVVLPTFGTTFSQSAKVLAESSSNSQIRHKNAGKSGNDPKMDPMFLKAGLHV